MRQMIAKLTTAILTMAMTLGMITGLASPTMAAGKDYSKGGPYIYFEVTLYDENYDAVKSPSTISVTEDDFVKQMDENKEFYGSYVAHVEVPDTAVYYAEGILTNPEGVPENNETYFTAVDTADSTDICMFDGNVSDEFFFTAYQESLYVDGEGYVICFDPIPEEDWGKDYVDPYEDPENPDTPDAPDTPDNPDDPEDPQNPDKPSTPSTPTTPGTDKPGTDKPGTTTDSKDETKADTPAACAHTWKQEITKASMTADGSTVKVCSKCGKKEASSKIARVANVTLQKTSFTYNGKAATPAVTVKDANGKVIPVANYTVTYKNNKNAGKATAVVTMKGNYTGSKTLTFNIKKATNTLKVKVKAKKAVVKASKLKKKAQKVSIKKAMSLKDAQGKVTYKAVKKGSSKKLSINKKTGKITVKKGTKKGTYKIKVKVKAAGNANYKALTKTVTAKVIVK